MAFGLAHAMAGFGAAGGIAAWGGAACSGRAPACATVADCCAEDEGSVVPPWSGHLEAIARGPSDWLSALDNGDAALTLVSTCVALRDVAALNHRPCTMLYAAADATEMTTIAPPVITWRLMSLPHMPSLYLGPTPIHRAA